MILSALLAATSSPPEPPLLQRTAELSLAVACTSSAAVRRRRGGAKSFRGDSLVYNTTDPQTWTLSAVGDWSSWKNFSTTAETRTHGAAHELTRIGSGTTPATILYETMGNITQNQRTPGTSSTYQNYVWDFDNRMISADTNGDNTADVTYEYDALGRRVARTQGATAVVYIHAGQQVVCDYTRGANANTTPAFRYVWGDYIDEPILRQSAAGTVLYFHHNQQYSTVALTNTSGEVVERYGYTAYGQLTVMNYLGNKRSWTDWSNRFLFTGREWDDSTKLFHFRARWYEPVAGRFVSRDPLGYVDGMGLYSGYFGLFQTDPFGLLLVDDGWGYSEWVWPWDPRANYNPCSTAKLWCEKTTLYCGAAIWGAGEGICNIGKGVGNTGVEITFCVRDVGVEAFCTQRSELWSQTGNAIANQDLTCGSYYTDVGVNFVTFGCKGQIDTFQEWQCGNITWDEASERFGTAGCFQLIGARQCHNTGGIWVRPIKSLPRDFVTICSGKVPNQWALSPRACNSLAKDPFFGPCLDELATASRNSAAKCREFAFCNGVGIVGKSGNGQCAMINAVNQEIQPGLPVYIPTGGLLCRKTPTLFLPRSPRYLFLPNCSKCLAEIKLRPELCPVPPKCPIITIPEICHQPGLLSARHSIND